MTARSRSGEWAGCWGLEKGRRVFFIIIKDSNHATNFEPCDIRHLQRHPEINKLVSRARQVEEKCFRSKRPNFASKNAFSPSAALRAAACKARVALGRVRQEKTHKIVTGLEPERHTRLKPSRKNFLRNSSPCSRPFGRAGWRSVHVQQGKRQNKPPEAVASGLCFGSSCWT